MKPNKYIKFSNIYFSLLYFIIIIPYLNIIISMIMIIYVFYSKREKCIKCMKLCIKQ